MFITKKEAVRIIGNKFANIGDDDNFYELIHSGLFEEVGFNSGVYGWNFSIYKSKKNGYYMIEGFRKAPSNKNINKETIYNLSQNLRKELNDTDFNISKKIDILNKYDDLLSQLI